MTSPSSPYKTRSKSRSTRFTYQDAPKLSISPPQDYEEEDEEDPDDEYVDQNQGDMSRPTSSTPSHGRQVNFGGVSAPSAPSAGQSVGESTSGSALPPFQPLQRAEFAGGGVPQFEQRKNTNYLLPPISDQIMRGTLRGGVDGRGGRKISRSASVVSLVKGFNEEGEYTNHMIFSPDGEYWQCTRWQGRGFNNVGGYFVPLGVLF